MKEASIFIHKGGVTSVNMARKLVGYDVTIALLIAHSGHLISQHSSPSPLELENSIDSVLQRCLPEPIYEKYLTEHVTYFLNHSSVLDNFSAHEIQYDDLVGKTLEHLYQAIKFVHYPEIVASVLATKSPLEAKMLAKQLGIAKYKRLDWKDVKLEVMKTLKRLKTAQHREVRYFLADHPQTVFIENSPSDYYWGCGEDMTGFNHDGRIWREVGDELLDGKIQIQ